METQDKIEDRAEDNKMMDDGEEECGGCCYSAVDTGFLSGGQIAYCHDQFTTNPR